MDKSALLESWENSSFWQNVDRVFFFLTLDPLLFSKKSLFISTLRLIHLKFPSQHLMGFDLILNLNLNLVFHLIKIFHMQDSPSDVATWFSKLWHVAPSYWMQFVELSIIDTSSLDNWFDQEKLIMINRTNVNTS